MKDIQDTLIINILEKLPPRLKESLKESIDHSKQNDFAQSLQSLSECIFFLIREEYFLPAGLVLDEEMGVLEMIRELRKAGKDLGKSETDAILRIQEKAKLGEIDSVVLESCFQGAVEVLESYLREKGNRIKKKAEATDRKSPGRFVLEELDALFLESDSEKKIRKNFQKVEEIYKDFPHDKDLRKIYLLFLSEVDKQLAKMEILAYLESGDVTIHLGSICIQLLAEMGFLYDAKKKLGWYEEEFPGEKDATYTELFVFLFSYIKDGREADRRRAEGLTGVFGSRKEPIYFYIENCFQIFSEREDFIQRKSEGLYLYKETLFREKAIQSKRDRLAELELLEIEMKERVKKSEEVPTPIQKKVEQIEPLKKINEAKIVEKIEPKEPRKYESKVYLKQGVFQADKTFTNSLGMSFELIPEGEFFMGAVSWDEDANEDEKPLHKVRITKPFFIGKHPVTQEEWVNVMGNNPSEFKEITEGLVFKKVIQVNLKNPVETVSWNDCQEFIRKLSQKEGKKYRLPTEAEWEYAARASTETIYSYGDTPYNLDENAHFIGNAGESTHPIAQKKPNHWNLHDMTGNVWEWMEDVYDTKFYQNSPKDDPKNSVEGVYRVLRGGSFKSGSSSMRLSRRYFYYPNIGLKDIGFRLVLIP